MPANRLNSYPSRGVRLPGKPLLQQSWLHHRSTHFLSVLLVGALLPLAFAPLHCWLLALCCPAYLCGYLHYEGRRLSAMTAGFAFGCGYFGSGVSWVYVSIAQYGETPFLLAAAITALFVAYLALYPAIFAVLSTQLTSRLKNLRAGLVIAASWVILEWLRGVLFSGFPWLFLGYAFLDSPLASFFPLVGVYGVSFLAMLMAQLPVLVVKKQKAAAFYLALGSIGLFIAAFSLAKVEWTAAAEQSSSVALLQGNIPQDLKWLQANQNTIINTYLELSAPLWDLDLIIWPESAITVPLPAAEGLLSGLQQKAAKHNTTLITGIPKQSRTANGVAYLNTVVAVSAGGSQEYAKRHLVPFGEYVPLQSELRGLIAFFDLPMSNFTKGAQEQHLLHTQHHLLQTAICYEIAYPHLSIANSGMADGLLTVSNDTWFGHSLGPAQHLQIARARAAEMAKPLLRATNSGLTAVVDHQGKIRAQAPPFTATALTTRFQGRTGETPIVRFGHHNVLLSIALLALCSLLMAFVSPTYTTDSSTTRSN